MEPSAYIPANKALWNTRTSHHMASGFYAMDDFRNGASSLKTIELALLGDVSGKDIVHLQCHFGQDTLSLARMGAGVIGVDFSEDAITAAEHLATDLSLPARFICSNVYDTLIHIPEATADIVFASYGVIGWLPDLDRWAQIIAALLKPGGAFIFAEFHPVLWMFDSAFKHIAYSYFKRGPIIELEEGTYADALAPISMNSVTWNHSIAEVMTSLMKAGLRIAHFEEWDYAPYPCFQDAVESVPGQYHIKGLEGKLPMVYSLKGILV